MRIKILLFSILFSFSSFAADFYWIGGNGLWSTPSEWSNVSNGAPGFLVPSNGDNVYFDAFSGLNAGSIVTIDLPIIVNDFDYSAVPAGFTFTSVLATIDFQGSLLSNGLANYTWGGTFNAVTSTIGKTITSNGFIWTNDFDVSGTEVISLSDNLNSIADIIITSGGLSSGGFLLDVENFISNSAVARSIDLSNSLVNINSANGIWSIDSTNLTWLTPPKITMANIGGIASFTGGGLGYDSLVSHANTLQTYDGNSFQYVELAFNSTWSIDNGTTQDVSVLETSGDCNNKTNIVTVNLAGAQSFINKIAGPTLSLTSVSINNVDADLAGGANYLLALSDTLSTSNWNFSGVGYYWINGAGNWSDVNHWSFTPAGLPAGCIPGPEDSVTFGAQSFSAINEIVTVDIPAYFAYMDWSNSTFDPIFHLDTNATSKGDVLFQPLMQVTRSSIAYGINFVRTAIFDPTNAPMDCSIGLYMINEFDSLNQISDVNATDTSGLTVISGEYFTNGNHLKIGTIQVFESPVFENKHLSIANSTVQLSNGYNSDGIVTNYTFDGTNSDIFIGNPLYINFLTSEGHVYNNVTLDIGDFDIFPQTLSGNNTFNKLKILKGSHLTVEGNSSHIINDSLIIQGDCKDSIYIATSPAAQSAFFTKSTAVNSVVECVDMAGIVSGGASLTALYSTNGGGNINWNFPNGGPTTSAFTANGPFCLGDTTFFTNNSTVVSGNLNDITTYWNFGDNSTSYYQFLSPTDSILINYELDTNQHEFLTSGSFDVMLVTEFTNSCRDTLVQTIDISDPDVYFQSSQIDTTICSGEEVIFNSSSSIPSPIFEYFINGVSQNTPTIADSIFITSGLINLDTISVISYQNGCPSNTEPSLVFVVKDAPIFSWSSSDLDTMICENDSVSFSKTGGQPSYVYQYLLNNAGVTPYTSVGNYVTNSFLDQDIISLVGQDTIGCTDTLNMVFTVNPLPVVTLIESSGSNVICSGETVTFTAGGSDLYEFFVAGVSQGTPNANNQFVTNQLLTGQTVSVVGSTLSGCSKISPQTYSYTVNSLPNISVSSSDANNQICFGESVTFTGSGGAQYEWFVNGTSQGPASFISAFNTAALNNQDTVFALGTINSCSDTSNINVFTVSPSPTLVFTSDDPDSSICFGTNVTFTSTGGTNYEYFINGTSQGPSSVSSVFSSSNLSNGQTIMVVAETNGCFDSESVNFTVLPKPNVSVFTDDANNIICESDVLTITGTNANTYELFMNGALAIGPQANSNFQPTIPNGINTFYVVGTGSNGCTDTTNTIQVTVNATPTIVLTTSDVDQIICQNDPVIFSGTGGNQYQFFVNGTSQGSMSITDTLILSNLSNGQIVSIQGSSFGCMNTGNSYSFTVNANPIASISSNDIDNVICADQTVIFSSGGGTNYQFYVDGISQGVSTNSNLTITNMPLGTYPVSVSTESSGCYDSTALSVTVNANPTASILSSDIDNIICSGESVTYTASGGVFYEFFVNGVSQGVASAFSSFTSTTLINNDIVSVNVINTEGCGSIATMAQITVNATPVISLTSSDPNNEICIGDLVTFTATGATNYEFFLNGVSQGLSGPAATFSSSTLTNGDQVYVTAESSNCPVTSPFIQTTVHAYPIVSLLNNGDNELCDTELSDLTANGATNYQFLINAAPASAFTANPNFNSLLTSGDVVSVIGETNGCQSTSASTYTFIVLPYPNLNSNPVNLTLCKDDAFVTNTSGASNYDFYLNNVLMQSGVSANFTISNLNNQDTITVVGSNGDCVAAPVNHIVTVLEMPLTLTSNNGALLCANEATVFNASGANQYQFFVNNVSQGAQSANNTFTTSTLNDLDEVTVFGFSTSTGCTQQLGYSIVIDIQATPQITPNGSLTFCEGDSVILVSNYGLGNQWLEGGMPIAGATDSLYTALTSGSYSLEITSGGQNEVWGIGNNSTGMIGDSTTLNAPSPAPANPTQPFLALSSGYSYLLGLTIAGDVYAWGNNADGQLGDGTYNSTETPIQLAALSNIKAIATGEKSSYAVTNTGDLYVWGANTYGQLGTGNNAVVNFPMLNTTITNVDTVVAGLTHVLVRLNDGTVWSAGRNNFGQLGNGSVVNSNLFIQVNGLSNIIAIGAGEHQSFAINQNGKLMAWGNNVNGQLGLGDNLSRDLPDETSVFQAIQVDGGANHTLILADENEVFVTGLNTQGQLGLGPIMVATSPLATGIKNVKQVSAGQNTSLVLRNDFGVLGFGNNNQGQISSGQPATIANPFDMQEVVGVTFVEASQHSSHFIFGEENVCSSTPVIVTMNVAPLPIVTQMNDTTLTTNMGASYQWYLAGNSIPNGTNQDLITHTSGFYTVAITYANGCTSISEPFRLDFASLTEDVFIDFKLYPNPAGDFVSVSFSHDKYLDKGQILDQYGRVVLNITQVYSDEKINVSDLENGIYYFVFHTSTGRYSSKFVKR